MPGGGDFNRRFRKKDDMCEILGVNLPCHICCNGGAARHPQIHMAKVFPQKWSNFSRRKNLALPPGGISRFWSSVKGVMKLRSQLRFTRISVTKKEASLDGIAWSWSIFSGFFLRDVGVSYKFLKINKIAPAFWRENIFQGQIYFILKTY